MSDQVPGEFVTFCQREQARLFRVLTLYCGDPLLAEELTQEALERACRRWGDVSGMVSPGAWVHRVAINLANSTFRRRRAERRAVGRAGSPAVYELPEIPAYIVLRDALAQLPDRWRRAVLLRHVAGLSVAEVGEVMGASESAVRTLTSRALSRLREAVEEDQEAGHAQ